MMNNSKSLSSWLAGAWQMETSTHLVSQNHENQPANCKLNSSCKYESVFVCFCLSQLSSTHTLGLQFSNLGCCIIEWP